MPKAEQVKRYGHTTYRDELCQIIIECFENGGSMADFCVEAGCGRKTVYGWMHAQPEFMQAYLYARECSKSYRDRKIEENLYVSNAEDAVNFNVNAYINLTKTRFRDMNAEHVPTPIISNTTDLKQAMINLAEHAQEGSLSTAQVKVMTGILAEMISISQNEDVNARIQTLYDIVASGSVKSSATVISPTAELEKPKPKAKAKKATKAKAKAKK